MPPKNTARRGGARPPGKRPQPGGLADDGGLEHDMEDGEGGFDEQTDAEKRQVRRKLRDMYEKLQARREKFTAGEDSEEFASVLKEANEILAQVKGTQEAIEDAKMFKLLCQSVREMSEDTNTNEKKFHADEFCSHIGRYINASTGHSGLQVTRSQLVSLGEKTSAKFRRTPTLTFILGAIDTEPPESRPAKERKIGRKADNRDKIATKTVIHEKSQASEQKTDRLVNSTRKLLETAYRQGGKKPVNYFQFVIDPESFGNTVENMFHVSFLVKQRVCRLSVDDKIDLPVLEPMLGRAEGEEERSKNQAVISISYQDWEDIKEALDITEAAIKHDDDLRLSVRN